MERKGKEWNDARNVSMNGYVIYKRALMDYPEYVYREIADAYREGTEWGSSHPALSAAERGIIDEVIFALKNLGEDKMISYGKEIELLERLRG
jgi:hypothetical protein